MLKFKDICERTVNITVLCFQYVTMHYSSLGLAGQYEDYGHKSKHSGGVAEPGVDFCHVAGVYVLNINLYIPVLIPQVAASVGG